MHADSPKVLNFDASLDPSAVLFDRACGRSGARELFINNTYSRPPDRWVIVTQEASDMVAHMCKQLSLGRKTLFLTSTTAMGSLVYKWALAQGLCERTSSTGTSAVTRSSTSWKT